ncbi:OmpA family protein [Arhodomonas sp. AD133]|uniref:OmpA family protein n=1 Tax=Arhodomonas sp. AD133 TaxID=3415009 RepID=UPI003EC0B260
MIRRSLLTLGLLAMLTGCATQPEEPDDTLDAAEAAISAAESSASVAEYAPVELAKARERLDEARQALGGGAQRRAEHLAYLAERHAQIAVAAAAAAEAEAVAGRIAREREQLRLSRREEQVERQQREIDQLREQLAELKPRETERGIVLTLGNVLFAFDSARLTEAAQSPLDRLAAFLREHPDRRIRVEGHTDSIGSPQYNQDLSKRRAQSVADAMIRRGVDPARMVVVGYGENRPIASNDSETGRQQNRRVEFVILDAASS